MRDIIHIARHKKPYNFSLQQELPWQSRPLVKRRHRLTVQERVTVPNGDVLTPLDEDEVRERVPAAARRRRRGRVGLPAALVPEPGARAADQGDRARGVPGGVPVRLARGAAALPRVRALLDRLPERVRRAEGLALRGQVRRGHAGRGLRARRAADAVLRRDGDGGGGDAAAGQPAHVRPGRRPDRGHLGRQGRGLRQRRHAGHGRHVRGHRRRRRRAPADAPPAGHEDRRLPGDGADGRHRHDRRRRRLDRLRGRGRRVPRRAAVRGRRPRPGLLRPRRHGADLDRRAAPARAAAPRPRAPRRARCSSTSTLRMRRWSRWPTRLGMSVEEAALGALQIQKYGMAQAIELNSVRRGYDPREFTLVAAGRRRAAVRVRPRARARDRPRARPALSRASSPPPGCSPPTSSTSSSPPSGTRSSRSTTPGCQRRYDELVGAGRGPARVRRRARRTAGSSAASPTAATRARATRCASTCPPATSTTPGSRR